MSRATAEEAAREIVRSMNDDQRRDYDRSAWAEGVSLMLDGEWSHLTEEDVLDAIDALQADRPRTERITIRLTAEERRVLEEAARRDRRPVSTWIAWAALREAGRG